jgi:predicted kinase
VEAVIFIGIQATGKSTFYKQRFFTTHVRINLDMLRTRHREELILRACLEAKQPFVIDNTNPTVADRARYIQPAKTAGFRVTGYYFESRATDAIARNALREPPQRVPERAILGTRNKLEIPSLTEGFDSLSYVSIGDDGSMHVQEWQDEVH